MLIIVNPGTDKVEAKHEDHQEQEILPKYPGFLIRRIRNDIDVQVGETDPTIAQPEYLEGTQPSDIQAIFAAMAPWMKTATSAEMETHIQNTSDFEELRTATSKLAALVGILRDVVHLKES